MNTYFKRALIGFAVQMTALVALTSVILWAFVSIVQFDTHWPSTIMVVVAAVVACCIYGGTLHDPVSEWIRDGREKDNDDVIIKYVDVKIEKAFKTHEEKHHKIDHADRASRLMKTHLKEWHSHGTENEK